MFPSKSEGLSKTFLKLFKEVTAVVYRGTEDLKGDFKFYIFNKEGDEYNIDTILDLIHLTVSGKELRWSIEAVHESEMDYYMSHLNTGEYQVYER